MVGDMAYLQPILPCVILVYLDNPLAPMLVAVLHRKKEETPRGFGAGPLLTQLLEQDPVHGGGGRVPFPINN
jgi:hypothetical protein